jgi:signal transduction histidine kinase
MFWRKLTRGRQKNRARGDHATEAAPELLYEHELAQRVALVRLVLTFANFAVIWLDSSLPSAGTAEAYAWAYGVAAVFLLYAFFIGAALKRRRIRLSRYLLLSPVLDVACASTLIIATDGYLSPFNLWLVFAVVSSGFSRYRRLPLFTAALGLLAHSLIATIPQEQPPDYAVFGVRTGYLFAFAAVLSLISSHLVAQAKALAVIEDAGRRLGDAATSHAALRILLAKLTETLHIAGARLSLSDGTCIEEGVPEHGCPATASWSLQVAGQQLGTLAVWRKSPLAREDDAVARVLCDRASSALLRIRLSEQLVAAAKAEERLRIADTLHDSCLQTLAAVALRAEAASRLVGGGGGEVASELQAITQVVRRAGVQLRDAVAMPSATAGGPDAASLSKLVTERWPGAQAYVAPDVVPSAGQWLAMEALIKEGLNNAEKHAAARRGSFRLYRSSAGHVVCVLENEGAPLPARPEFGYGLTRVRELVEAQGGVLSLVPREAGGALLIADFGDAPCKPSGS